MKGKKLKGDKLKIAKLKEELVNVSSRVEYWRGKYEELKDTKEEAIDNISKAYTKIEGRESQIYDVNERLWALLNLIVVPADKLEELQKIQDERGMRQRRF